ncbi:MAG: UDP-glucuronic acid decarboxylase family protein [Bacteroidaceae bacterium]
MKKILVTGGAGFIGNHLCTRLVKEGNEVMCLDNFYTGSKDNVSHLMDCHNFKLIQHNIVYPFWTEVDEIYNLACPASPIHYQLNPIQTTKVSVLGAINMLELARRSNAKILQASTSEVYGDPEVHPQIEAYWGNVNTIGVRSCYDEGKRCAETLFFDYYRQYNIHIKIVRIFNTYGPFMQPNDGRVISNFMKQALSGNDITIYGDGSQTRSFQYIDDLVEGFIKMMGSKDLFKGPVNIGNPKEYTIKEIAERIIKLTKSKSKIKYLELPFDDPRRRKPDISLAKKELDWAPKISLDEGLERMLESIKKNNALWI